MRDAIFHNLYATQASPSNAYFGGFCLPSRTFIIYAFPSIRVRAESDGTVSHMIPCHRQIILAKGVVVPHRGEL